MELSVRPIPNPCAVLQETGDGWAVLVNLDTAGSLALNPTGIIVWRLVDGRRSVEEIVAGVRRCFRDTPPAVDRDVSGLLEMLAEEGLVGFEWTADGANRQV